MYMNTHVYDYVYMYEYIYISLSLQPYSATLPRVGLGEGRQTKRASVLHVCV